MLLVHCAREKLPGGPRRPRHHPAKPIPAPSASTATAPTTGITRPVSRTAADVHGGDGVPPPLLLRVHQPGAALRVPAQQLHIITCMYIETIHFLSNTVLFTYLMECLHRFCSGECISQALRLECPLNIYIYCACTSEAYPQVCTYLYAVLDISDEVPPSLLLRRVH